jgi:hypothetical protein
MFYKAKVAVCSEIRTKHIKAMWTPRKIFLILNLVVCKVTARLYKVTVRSVNACSEIVAYEEERLNLNLW